MISSGCLSGCPFAPGQTLGADRVPAEYGVEYISVNFTPSYDSARCCHGLPDRAPDHCPPHHRRVSACTAGRGQPTALPEGRSTGHSRAAPVSNNPPLPSHSPPKSSEWEEPQQAPPLRPGSAAGAFRLMPRLPAPRGARPRRYGVHRVSRARGRPACSVTMKNLAERVEPVGAAQKRIVRLQTAFVVGR